MRHSPVPLLCVGLALMLAACGQTATAHGSMPQEKASSSSPMTGGPVINRLEDPEFGMEALLSGPLNLEHGCLLIGSRPTIWPTYAQWDQVSKRVVSAKETGDGIDVGERVHLPGGTIGIDSALTFLSPVNSEQLQQCASRANSTDVDIVSSFP